MSIGSGADHSKSNKKALEALSLFRTIQPKDKLRFHRTTDTFEIDREGNNFKRTFNNMFRKSGTENSVTNDEMFHTPIVLVFKMARLTESMPELNSAYLGLKNLEKTYEKEPAKLAALNKTLVEVKSTIDEPFRLSSDSLLILSEKLSRQALNIFNEYAKQADAPLASSVIQQMNLSDRESLQVIFAAVRNDGSRISNNLIEIERGLNFFSNPSRVMRAGSNRIDVSRISDLVYNVLQEVEKAEIQTFATSQFDRWISKLKKATNNGGFQTFFQSNQSLSLNSDIVSHPENSFLWFNGKSRPVENITRLYFCPMNMFNVDQFIRAAGEILNSKAFVFSFKIDYRKDLRFERKDAIVLYFEGDMEKGRALAAEFHSRLDLGYFKPNFGPFGGKSVSEHNDVFWQPEPDRFDTGMNNKEKNPVFKNGHRIGQQHSATSIRAELITMALLKWKIEFDYQVAKCIDGGMDKPDLHDPRVYEFEFDLFQSYVAHSLDGYKHLLNPRLNP